MKWYKRDCDRALVGMTGLTLEERGAYNTIIDLSYSRGAVLPDDDDLLLRHLGCHWRVWQRIKTSLISKNKLRIEDGKIIGNGILEGLHEASRWAQERRKNEKSSTISTKIADTTTSTLTTKKVSKKESKNAQPLAELGERPPAAPANRPKKSATRLAENWQPSEDDLAFARTLLPADHILAEADKFRDHWIQSNQPTAVKRDWSAAWRTWCRKAVEYGIRGRIPANQAKPTIMEAVDNLFGRLNGSEPGKTDPYPVRLVSNRGG